MRRGMLRLHVREPNADCSAKQKNGMRVASREIECNKLLLRQRFGSFHPHRLQLLRIDPQYLEDGRRHLRGRNRGLHGSVMASALVSFLRRSLESTSAPTPPAELTPAVTMVAVEIHSGHIGWLL